MTALPTASCQHRHRHPREWQQHDHIQYAVAEPIALGGCSGSSVTCTGALTADDPRRIPSSSASPPTASKASIIMANKRSKLSNGASSHWLSLEYSTGFNNHHSTEAVPGVLPTGQNSPQVVAHGLFAEQLSGTAFTCPRSTNKRSWLYRLSPSVRQGSYAPCASARSLNAAFTVVDPSPRRWSPMPLASRQDSVDFVDGLQTMCGAGDPSLKEGVAIHMYTCNAPMIDRAFCDADGECLIVPQLGVLHVTTELGRLRVAPGEILVVPRNIRFSVTPGAAAGDGSDDDLACRGYMLEVFASRGFVLPDLGPIGANGLAEPRDFMTPVAWYEDRACPGGFTITTKYAGEVFDVSRDYSPYDVVAWHGNYAPYKYDLSCFHAVNSVTADHSDPSIFTVLTCPSQEPGVAVADFVIFPPRWLCAEHTFRPPYFHRNVMSEFMGLVGGTYDAKAGGEEGFAPSGASLHVASTPHGPDAESYDAAVKADTSRPVKFAGGLAFMFETSAHLKLTAAAASSGAAQPGYAKCWEALPRAHIAKGA